MNKRGGSKIDVHYGMAGHVTTTIAVAYAFFRWAVDFCQEEEEEEEVIQEQGKSNTNNYYCQDDDDDDSLFVPLLQPQDYISVELPSKQWMQQNKPDEVIPNITEFLLPVISNNKNNNNKGPGVLNTTTSCSSSRRHHHQHTCSFAFLAAPLGTHSKKGPLQEYINQYTIHDDGGGGWQVQNNFRHGGFQNKLGLAATAPHAKLHLQFPLVTTTTTTLPQQLRLTIHHLKSYGPEWANTRVKGSVQIHGGKKKKKKGTEEEPPPSHLFFLEGYHEQNVSISYTHVVDGIEVVSNNDANNNNLLVDLTLELIGGTTFKINAMMLCAY